MITGRKHGKCDYYVCPSGYARGTIRWWCNFYLELAADKENPCAEREKIRYLPRWTRGALRIIFTCGHRCFVDGRIRALIKLMQPTSAPRTDRTLPLHGLSRHGLSMRVHTRTRVRRGRVTFMERYTLWKRVWECVASGSSSRFLRARFSQIGSGKNGARVNLGTAFSIRFPGKTGVFSTIIRLSSGRPDSPTFSCVFVIYFSRAKIHQISY